MYSKNTRPKWWQLYLTFPLLVLLFIIESHLRLSTRGHEVVQIGIIVLVYLLISLWIKTNSQALSNMDENKGDQPIVAIQFPAYELHQPGEAKRSTASLSQSEVRGLLGDTTDLEDLPVHPARQAEDAPYQSNRE